MAQALANQQPLMGQLQPAPACLSTTVAQALANQQPFVGQWQPERTNERTTCNVIGSKDYIF